ncbi:pectin esterase [Flavobacterium sp. Sd200]|uniref:pectinesterase family protein n=1 Tax=Flavobacterium sp. Sd200 TaxID=2692211 RepID=UPI00136B4E3E|nr:pectinesterase family protein [Flavobacterium sp. Sd200]MXN92331.1 pectin esterase [Flavobacterium sp. Sd200]
MNKILSKVLLKVAILSVFVFLTNCSVTDKSVKNQNTEAKLYDIVVAKDGTGNYKTVQEAVNSVPSLKMTETKIFIKGGTYKEKLEIPKDKNNVTLIGENTEKVILTYDDYASKKNSEGQNIGTSGSASFIVTANNFTAKSITFENASGPVGQAVAVRIDGDKVVFDNCRFLGFQDTLYPREATSRQYYKNCYIEGTVDFIFGASTAVFDQCEIFAKADGGYLTAASTPEKNQYGFVFLNCKLTTDSAANSYYLGRPWRNYAKTVFIKCNIGAHIKPEGWHNWDKREAESTTFYAEYLSEGMGRNTDSRVSWSRQLTQEQFTKDYTLKAIFKDWTPVL